LILIPDFGCLISDLFEKVFPFSGGLRVSPTGGDYSQVFIFSDGAHEGYRRLGGLAWPLLFKEYFAGLVAGDRIFHLVPAVNLPLSSG